MIRWDQTHSDGQDSLEISIRPGAVGCAESHKAVIDTCKRSNEVLNNVMVFEDDFNICDDWKNNLDCALRDIEDKVWSIFYLGYHLHKPPAGLIRKSCVIV